MGKGQQKRRCRLSTSYLFHLPLSDCVDCQYYTNLSDPSTRDASTLLKPPRSRPLGSFAETLPLAGVGGQPRTRLILRIQLDFRIPHTAYFS